MKIDMAGSVWTLVIVGIILAVGAIVLDKFQAQTTANSTAYNILGQALSALQTFGGFLGIIAVTVVTAVVIGLIYGVFGTSGETL